MARGKVLELLRPDPNTGKVYPILTVEVFGIVRSLMPFRLTGGSKGLATAFSIKNILSYLGSMTLTLAYYDITISIGIILLTYKISYVKAVDFYP